MRPGAITSGPATRSGAGEKAKNPGATNYGRAVEPRPAEKKISPAEVLSASSQQTHEVAGPVIQPAAAHSATTSGGAVTLSPGP